MKLTEKQKIIITAISTVYVAIGVSINSYNINKKYKTIDIPKYTYTHMDLSNITINNCYSLVKRNSMFLDKLSKLESNNNWKSVGGSHGKYIGKYQFGRIALKDIGLYPKVSLHKFKKDKSIFNSHLQDRACIMLMIHNNTYMEGYYKFIGHRINGILITKAGILASAHLLGHKEVKKWLDTHGKHKAQDSFGTSIEKYMRAMENIKVYL